MLTLTAVLDVKIIQCIKYRTGTTEGFEILSPQKKKGELFFIFNHLFGAGKTKGKAAARGAPSLSAEAPFSFVRLVSKQLPDLRQKTPSVEQARVGKKGREWRT